MAQDVFTIVASVINGEIQPFPKRVDLPCDQVQAAGMTIIRDYDDNYCIVNKKVFLLVYKEQTFGTTQFKTMEQWWQFQFSQCGCFFYIDGCVAEINGTEVSV